jgi:hypothetical protein
MMSFRAFIPLGCCAAAIALFPCAALRGDPLWKKLNMFHKIDANPDHDYPVSEKNGPWMIAAATFSGEGAQEQARALVFELRSRYKFPAYTHRKTFDYTQPVRGVGVDRYNNPKWMRHQRDARIEEIAVLVGDYPQVDDPQAEKDLSAIKHARPDALNPTRDGQTRQQLRGWREMYQRLAREGKEKKRYGPMCRAFVTTNPLLPPQFFASKGVDRLIEEMNKNVTHSLLDCPGKYTVQVAMFKGTVVLDDRKLRAIEAGTYEPKSQLTDAAEKAHRVCEALRAKGYEAYEFHDRSASIVTVGSFNAVGTRRPDGKTELDPRIHKIMATFAAAEAAGPSDPLRPQMTTSHFARQPQRVAGIPLDLQPIPVTVPKRSFKSALGQQ